MTKFSSRRLALTLLFLGAQLSLAPNLALARSADDAPVPSKMPRTPVQRQKLNTPAPEAPPRHLSGKAQVLDTDKLRVNGYDLRLFGVVPPQLSANFGPQARATLDALASSGPLECDIRDRTRDNSLLAVCQNSHGVDLSLEMLARGYAVAARGTLNGTNYATSYLNTEKIAADNKLGLWGNPPPPKPQPATQAQLPAAAMADHTTPATPATQAAQTASLKISDGLAPSASSTGSQPHVNGQSTSTTAATADSKADKTTDTVAETNAHQGLIADFIAKLTTDKNPAKPTIPLADSAADVSGPTAEITSSPIKDNAVSPPPAATQEGAQEGIEQPISLTPPENTNGLEAFLSRFQLLITGCLMILTSLLILMGLGFSHRKGRKQEIRSIAAALRGELQAAKAVCLGRLHALAEENDSSLGAWPRIRILVFQAYVGRVGHLGAELARKIASIYGQASDYSAYFAATEAQHSPKISKRQALQTLINHIDDVLPKLAKVELTGKTPYISVKDSQNSPAKKLPRLNLKATTGKTLQVVQKQLKQKAQNMRKLLPQPPSDQKTDISAEVSQNQQNHVPESSLSNISGTSGIAQTSPTHDTHTGSATPNMAVAGTANAIAANTPPAHVLDKAPLVRKRNWQRAQFGNLHGTPEANIQSEFDVVATPASPSAEKTHAETSSPNIQQMAAQTSSGVSVNTSNKSTLIKPEPSASANFGLFAAKPDETPATFNSSAPASVVASTSASTPDEVLNTQQKKSSDALMAEVAPQNKRPLWGLLEDLNKIPDMPEPDSFGLTETNIKTTAAQGTAKAEQSGLTDDELIALEYDMDEEEKKPATPQKAGAV